MHFLYALVRKSSFSKAQGFIIPATDTHGYGGIDTPYVDNSKYLRISIDRTLLWKTHIKNITVVFLRWVFHYKAIWWLALCMHFLTCFAASWQPALRQRLGAVPATSGDAAPKRCLAGGESDLQHAQLTFN